MHTKEFLSILERNNKTAIKAHFISSIVMIIFCLLQVVGGFQNASFALISIILGLGPVITEKIIRKKNPASPHIKPLLAIGFLIFYSYSLFTSTNNMVFVFVIPMIMIISIYNDTRYSLFVNGIALLESILVVAIGSGTGRFGYLGMDYAIIQIVIMIMIMGFSKMTAGTLNANSNQQLAAAEELSVQLQNGIKEIHANLEHLNTSSNQTAQAMQEVSIGISNTTDAVTKQISQTHQIQEKVNHVDDASERIVQNMNDTLDVLASGNQNVTRLVEQAERSVQNSVEVAAKLEILNQYMSKMNSIVAIIDDITFQTKLLAVNASIEAAHAGEAGLGFAVVASEITGMSEKTENATTRIIGLIKNVSRAITEVVEVVYQMIDDINAEKVSTQSTSEIFGSIHAHALAVHDNIKNLEHNVELLKISNQTIVDSIHTISNISEEVSAHTTQTLTLENENTQILADIDEKINGLIRLIQAS